MKLAMLGSGSKGNALLVRSNQCTLLVDCGFSVKETCARLQQIDVDPTDIDAILVTHEHGDHIHGVGPMARKFKLPVWMTRGTELNSRCGTIKQLNTIDGYQGFTIGDIQVTPFPVPHDAREPSQFLFDDGDYKCGLLTDVGMITSHITESLARCDGMVLEFNHDWNMLQYGKYPARLKRRVSGDYGHLNNLQAAELLSQIKHEHIKHVIAAHLSEENNCTDTVSGLLQNVLGDVATEYQIAPQNKPMDWVSLR